MTAASAAIAATVAATLLAAATGCAGPHAAAQDGRPITPAVVTISAPSTPVTGSIFGRSFSDPDLAAAGGSLYLRWSLSAQQFPPREALARVDAATGRIITVNQFSPGLVSDPLYAAGSLWVTDSSSSAGELLLRLDPRSLMVTGALKVADVAANEPVDGQIAFAGGTIWVDGLGRLVQVAPGPVTAIRTITFPGADSSSVGASPDGRTLIVSEASAGTGTIQRRDPVTGTLLAAHPAAGAVAPRIAAVSAATTWVAQPTGMLGYVERFQTAALTPDPATQVMGSDGISADIWNGVLWVTSPVGGSSTNFCADPGSGRRLAPLPFLNSAAHRLLAVTGKHLYYASAASGGAASRIAAMPVPAACQRGPSAG